MSRDHPDAEQLKRPSSDSINRILGKTWPVLDDGFVRVVDYMGNDDSIVQAARVSYGAGTKKAHEDRGLIRYLMRHHHTTPFEMCEVKLHVRAPMDCWRQWIRHRTANVNEYSTRYSVAIDAMQRTEPGSWRLQSSSTRQGSEGFISTKDGEQLSARELELHRLVRAEYEARLSAGVSREQARKDLPLSTYTEAYWKIDLHNLLHFLKLRMDDHAQWEIRQYARTIGYEIVALWCPIAWEAFLEYSFESVRLSKLEAEIVALLVAGRQQQAVQLLRERNLLIRRNGVLTANRERAELETKLGQLGFSIPW